MILDFLAIAAAIVLHEAGHALAAACCGLEIRRFGICRRGPYTVRESGTPAQNAIVSVAGPLANVALGLMWPEYRIANLVMAAVCLLPMPHSDGAHALAAMRGGRK